MRLTLGKTVRQVVTLVLCNVTYKNLIDYYQEIPRLPPVRKLCLPVHHQYPPCANVWTRRLPVCLNSILGAIIDAIARAFSLPVEEQKSVSTAPKTTVDTTELSQVILMQETFTRCPQQNVCSLRLIILRTAPAPIWTVVNVGGLQF